jgi:CRP/FNR family transcriptional regulator, cyclic AMP receptor protein
MQTIVELLTVAPTFGGLARDELELIAGCGEVTGFGADDVLFQAGGPADRFFVIRHGTVALEVHTPQHEPLVIETLHERETVGWSWLFAPYRWQFDARAVEPVVAVAFDAVCVRAKCDADHELGYRMMIRFAGTIVERLQATRVQLLDVYGRARVG